MSRPDELVGSSTPSADNPDCAVTLTSFHSFQAECDDVLDMPVAGGTALAISRPSPDGSGTNEDSASIIPIARHCGVLIVADGLGGHAAGQTASQLAARVLESTLREHIGADSQTIEPSQLRAAILNGFENANREINALGTGAATTLCVAEIIGDQIRTYHVGDSGALLIGQRGKIKLQTVAHSPVGYALEAGLIDEEDAMHHEDRHIISNILGSDEMRIEIGPSRSMAAKDTLLLSSDGLLDNLWTEEIVEGMRKGPLLKSMQDLADEASLRMLSKVNSEQPSKPDDLTIVAFRRT